MKRLCRMPLSGQLFEYTDRVELVNHIATFFGVQSLQQIRLVDADVEETIEDDHKIIEGAHVDVYAFIDPLHINITRSELADGGSGTFMVWRDVVNEDLLRLAVHHQHLLDDERANLFANPHPIVVEMLLHHLPLDTLSPHLASAILSKASANPSPLVMEWLFANHPESIDWVEMCGNSEEKHVERAVEHYREILTVTPNARIASKAVHNLLGTDFAEFAIDYLGGLDHCMRTLLPSLEFLRNQSAYAIEKKREWVASQMGQNGYDFVLKACMQTEDDELVRLGFDALIASPSNPWQTVDDVLKANAELWQNQSDVVVDHLLAYMNKNTPQSVVEKCRARLAFNEHPRIVDFLLTNVNGDTDDNEWIWLKMPEFLSNTNERAVAYSLAWIERHYTSLLANPIHLQTYASAASGNTHTEMIYAIHNKFPRLKSTVESQWMYALGRNPHIRVVMRDADD